MNRWTPDGTRPTKVKNMAGISSYSFNAAEGLDLARYRAYWFFLENLAVGTDDTGIEIRTSGDSGASDYTRVGQSWRSNDATISNFASATTTSLVLNGNADTANRLGNVTGSREFGMSGRVVLRSGGSALDNPHIAWRVTYRNTSSNLVFNSGSGSRNNTTAITSVDFRSTTGANFASGNIFIYGQKRIS